MPTRAAWVQRHPPNHAGYYFCHICGGWVHKDAAELDHVTAKSIIRAGLDPNRDDNRRMSHTFVQTTDRGVVYCIGNREKGSKEVISATMEIAPSDEEW